VRFEALDDNTTRLQVRIAYHPPAGALGHAIARLFGRDPKHQLDDDLLRFKSLLENGKARGRGRQVSRQEIAPRPPTAQA
jgi:uncharacterized membrane protein